MDAEHCRSGLENICAAGVGKQDVDFYRTSRVAEVLAALEGGQPRVGYVWIRIQEGPRQLNPLAGKVGGGFDWLVLSVNQNNPTDGRHILGSTAIRIETGIRLFHAKRLLDGIHGQRRTKALVRVSL